MNIIITVTNKIAAPVNPPVIVCGNSNYVIDFVFDSEWDDYEIKTARFSYKKDGENQYKEVAFTGKQCTMPVLAGITEVSVGVYSGDLQTTTPAILTCAKSILCADPIHFSPSEDVYNQIIKILNENYPVEAAIAANEAANNANEAAARAIAELLKTQQELQESNFIEYLKEQNKGESFSVWIGTSEEYAQIQEKNKKCLYLLLDKLSLPELISQVEQLNQVITDEILKLNEELTKKFDTLNQNFTAEVTTLNERITAEVIALNERINAVESKLYPVGSTYITYSNSNPASVLGGTWELYDKKFTPLKTWTQNANELSHFIQGAVIEGVTQTIGTGVNVIALGRSYSGNSIEITIQARGTGAVLKTLPKNIIQFQPVEEWGIKYITGQNVILPHYCYAFGDNYNTILPLEIFNSTRGTNGGYVTVYVHNKLNGEDMLLTEGQLIAFTFTITLQKENMVDDMCNKFYWTRTA